MIQIVKVVVLAAPIIVTFVDAVGYIARVDGRRIFVFILFFIDLKRILIKYSINQEHQCNRH